MEYLDVYDESKNYIGKFTRQEVHEKGYWHNTVHCWLYDLDGNVFFQVRSDDEKLYTTASGHVLTGETIKEAFGREVKEEIGIDLNYEDAEVLDIVIWQMNKEKNGQIIKDRAFANVYLLSIDENNFVFKFLDGEVKGIVKVKAKDALDMFNGNLKEIEGILIDANNQKSHKSLTAADFLLMKGETLIGKYGQILNAIKEK